MTLLGLMDEEPTGLVSRTTQGDYHGPAGVVATRSMHCLNGWLLTGSREDLDKAERLIRRACIPRWISRAGFAGDGVALVVYGFPVGLRAVSRPQGRGRARSTVMYAYGRSCLLDLCVLDAGQRGPVFRSPRKAGVPHRDLGRTGIPQGQRPPLGGRARPRIRCGPGSSVGVTSWPTAPGEISRSSSHVTSPGPWPLMMVEGGRDSYWRKRPIGCMPEPARTFDFGMPQDVRPAEATSH